MAKSVRIGVIGLGSVSEKYVPHIRRLNIEGTPCDIVIGCDLRPGLAERARGWAIPAFTTDYHEVLAHPDVDLVLILTSMQSHGQLTRDALNAGKHVYSEKPLTYRSPEGVEALKMAHPDVTIYLAAIDDLAYDELFDDIVPSLDALDELGIRLGVISNWDYSLHRVLKALEVHHRFEFVIELLRQ